MKFNIENVDCHQINFLSFMTFNISFPISAGLLVTIIPAFYNALIFSGALPLPPLTIAPA